MIEAVCAGYAGGQDVWVMTPNGVVETVTIGETLPSPYFYSDTKLSGNGVVNSALESVKLLRQNEVQDLRLWKVEVDAPGMVQRLRGKSRVTAEDDITYLERRLGADGQIAWTVPKRVSFLDIETNRQTGELELVGTVLNGKYEPFRTALEYFQYLEDEKVAAVTAWNGDNFDFRYLDLIGGSEYWSRVQKMDSMALYSRFSPKHTRRGLDIVARREKVGQKLDEAEVGLEAYNENDCRIMEEIIKKQDIIGTMFALAEVTGIMPAVENLRAIAMMENYLMKNRAKYNLWLEGKHGFVQNRERFQGGLVIYGNPGIYDGAGMFDYTSLYPNAVMHSKWEGDGRQVWQVFQKLANDFVRLKEEAGRRGLKSQREAFKVLANGSGYGIFANASFRYMNREIAAFITEVGRAKLMELREVVIGHGFEPVISDTDSCAVVLPKGKAGSMLRVINRRVAPYQVKLEWYATRLILFGGVRGEVTKKRYASLTDEGELVVKGLEMVRSDWSPWAREFQERLLMVMLTAPREDVARRLGESVKVEKEAFFGGKVPVDDVAITKSIDTEKDYKVATQSKSAFNLLKSKGTGVISFVTYWIDGRGKPMVRNGETDEEMRMKVDWRAIWRKQAEPIVERLKSCYQPKVKSLDVWLEAI